MISIVMLGTGQHSLDSQVATGSSNEGDENFVVAMTTVVIEDMDDGLDGFDGNVLHRDLEQSSAVFVPNGFACGIHRGRSEKQF